MFWRKFLINQTKELAKYLQSDIQYQGILTEDVFRIAQKELEIYINHKKNWNAKQLFLNEKKEITRTDQANIEKFVSERKKRIPLGYIIGTQSFYGLDFKVNRHTLIPRPETEELVEYALLEITKIKKRSIILADIGTGSGCIITAFLRNLPRNIKLNGVFAIDQNLNALKYAKLNANLLLGKNNGVKFLKGSLLSPILRKKTSLDSLYFILANLPYLSEEEFGGLSLEVSQEEPRIALVGGKYGQELIIQLINEALQEKRKHLEKNFEIFLEISPTISNAIKKYCLSNNIKTKVKKDLSGKDRFLHLSF